MREKTLTLFVSILDYLISQWKWEGGRVTRVLKQREDDRFAINVGHRSFYPEISVLQWQI